MEKGSLVLRRAVGNRDEISVGGVANFQPNLIGGLSAERCVPGEVPASVLADHLARYVWAVPRVANATVVELGSGSGYGTHLLSLGSRFAIGIDIDGEAIAWAKKQFIGPEYMVGDITNPPDLPEGDIAVCFEVLEHVSEPRAVLTAALARYPRLLLSVPNPLGGGSHINPHHRLDWPLRCLLQELEAAGAQDVKRFHQNYWSPRVKHGAHGLSFTWILDIRK